MNREEAVKKFIIDDLSKRVAEHLADILSSEAQPERKKGKWKHGCCSECGYNWGKDAPIASVPNFCPHCGADMREEMSE